MRRFNVLALLVAALLVSDAAGASTVDYTTPGTYAVPPNCGFTVLSTSNGWIRMTLSGDVPGHVADLWVRAGEEYPLRLQEVTLFSAPVPTASIRVNTTAACMCGVQLDPFAPAGLCYTKSANADECETDPNRPEINDPEAVPPGPDIPFFNVGFYGSGAGDVDTIGIGQPDWGYWTVARLREGQWQYGGIRRCRLVDGSANGFLTLIAP